MQATLDFINPVQELSFANEVLLSYKKSPLLQKDCFKALNNSQKMSDFLRSIWNEELELRESFYIVCCNLKLDVVGYKKIADGGLDAVMVDLRILFTTALLCNSSSIIVAHNHPSGTLRPSSADISLTDKIKSASKILDIKLLDHIILTPDSYYSFTDNGDL